MWNTIKVNIKTPEGRFWRRSDVFVVNLEQYLYHILMFLLLTLNRQMFVVTKRPLKHVEVPTKVSGKKYAFDNNRSLWIDYNDIEALIYIRKNILQSKNSLYYEEYLNSHKANQTGF